jgi:hypothetical protein
MKLKNSYFLHEFILRFTEKMVRTPMLIKTLLSAILIMISFSSGNAGDAVTPYGDYCKECTTYGKCKTPLTPKQAIDAIEQYYGDKGYVVKNKQHKGRFVEAEIHDETKLVDKVLFDRHTGRFRSIY